MGEVGLNWFVGFGANCLLVGPGPTGGNVLRGKGL